MFPATESQKAVFLGSHQLEMKVSVLRGSSRVAESIPFVSASVSATYATQGGREATLVVDKGVIDQGLLNPLSDIVLIQSIVPGVIQVPLFAGRVDASNASFGQVEVPLISTGVEAIRAAFEVPWAAIDGNQARDEIRRILKSINPSWGVDTTRAQSSTIARNLVWEDDPGQALDDLARGASLIWQPDRTYGFEVFTNPFLLGSAGATAQITFQDGVNGTTVDVEEAKNREGLYNSVTVVAEKYGNQAAIRATVRDNNPASPTYWGGVFGKQNLIVKSQTPIDVGQASQLALRILNQSLALQRTWTVTVPNMPLLDPGDVYALWYNNEVTAQVVVNIDYTTDAQSPTVITSRELRAIVPQLLDA